MAYARRSLKRKTTKKRSSMKRKAPKARKTSRGTSSKSASHRQTGYFKAVTDPINGPLVGVPQFVPIETHRVRARAIGTITTTTTDARICFNPCRMVANDTLPITAWDNQGGGGIDESKAQMSGMPLQSNTEYAHTDFQATAYNNTATINNGDGIKARVVGAVLRVCNVSSVQTRGGVFTALHEPHHKTVQTFTRNDLASNAKSIIKPAGDGSYVSLLYRPVKPEEVEDWQISPWTVPGGIYAQVANVAGDGTTLDSYPGYMVVDFKGEVGTTLHIEAYAIIEYAGESLTTLSRPIHLGGGKKAEPKDMPAIGTDLKKLEGGGDSLMPQAGPPHDRPAGDVLALPRPKKPTPDNEMDYDFNSPKKEKKKKEKKKKKSKSRRALLQVNRTMTDREWADISRSVGKVRSRPSSSAHFGRARIGGGYQARKKLQRNRATYPVGSRFWRR